MASNDSLTIECMAGGDHMRYVRLLVEIEG